MNNNILKYAILERLFADDADEHSNFLKYELVVEFNLKNPVPPPLSILVYGYKIISWLIRIFLKNWKPNSQKDIRLPLRIDGYLHVST